MNELQTHPRDGLVVCYHPHGQTHYIKYDDLGFCFCFNILRFDKILKGIAGILNQWFKGDLDDDESTEM